MLQQVFCWKKKVFLTLLRLFRQRQIPLKESQIQAISILNIFFSKMQRCIKLSSRIRQLSTRYNCDNTRVIYLSVEVFFFMGLDKQASVNLRVNKTWMTIAHLYKKKISPLEQGLDRDGQYVSFVCKIHWFAIISTFQHVAECAALVCTIMYVRYVDYFKFLFISIRMQNWF